MRSAAVVPVLSVTLATVSLAVAVSILAGCGINDGFKHDLASGDQHQYRMDLSGIRYARTVAGTASIGSILCFGFPWAGAWVPGIPLDHGLYKQAMEALHEDAKLKPNEVLKDLRTDHDPTCYLLLYGVNSLTVSADVYELTPAGASGAAGPPAVGRATDSAPAVAEPWRAPPPDGTRAAWIARPTGKLTYAQLQEAYAQIQSNQDSTSHLGMAVRLLGNPHKIDADSEYWFGTLPGKSDCFMLKVSAAKGDSLDTAPNDKCK